ncbi:MAG TPA: hypothetical protein VFP11_16495 [Candidatus Angelobacter sp.]|jgi:hypothetical protein|nr:hypothetical protein [Candidatus Angelobacter sp.]
MKKLSTWVVTLFLGATLALAQTGGDKGATNPQPTPPGKKATTASTTKSKSGKKGHKGGKKSKKNSGSTTPPPK